MYLTQPTMADEERLAAMFSKNMNLDNVQPQPEQPKIVYISQHYTHSAHVAQQPVESPEPSPRPASEPPQREHIMVELVLRNHGVDPSCLSSSQLQLFKTAEEPQQLRLIELWRICPPTNSNDNPTLAWNFSSSLEDEELMAKARFLRSLAPAAGPEETMMSLDGTPLTPVQAGDGRWIGIASEAQHYMEPYMSSGYDHLMEMEKLAQRADVPRVGIYKPSTDPVYNSTTASLDWSQQAQMEDQYGRMMAMRNVDEEML